MIKRRKCIQANLLPKPGVYINGRLLPVTQNHRSIPKGCET